MRISDWSSDVCSSDLGVQFARLAGRVAGAVQDAVTLLDLESGCRDQRVRGRLPLHARLILHAGLWPVGRDRSAVDILNRACDRQEAFGIAEKGREARADLADDAGAKGGGIVIVARRAGNVVAAIVPHDSEADGAEDLLLNIKIGRACSREQV